MIKYFKTTAIAASIMLSVTGCSVTDSMTLKNEEIKKLNKEITEKNTILTMVHPNKKRIGQVVTKQETH